ncbi:MAG: phage major capsid protein [Bacteroidia bacterium]|nr:phage major capsid protein [Bacteroidia bacterium]
MNYAENRIHTGQPEYEKQFWNSMKGVPFAEDRLEGGRSSATGTFALPVSADNKYEAEINKMSVFRKLASVFTRYNSAVDIITANSDDIAEFVPESESIDIRDVVDDFDTVRVTATKLATLLRLPSEFVADAAFNLEGYLIKRLARNFARAEDKGFITGTGTDEPVGILDNTAGAETAATVETITYDDVIALYFSVKAEYRTNAVWLMNDKTALALRKLKDSAGNYLWNNADNTILGKPVMISEYMPDAEEGTKPIAFGDFSYYWIVKRTPVSVKMLQELFALRHQTGYLAFEFIDGKLIRTDAVKVIKMASE